jgi:hypothetical protein
MEDNRITERDENGRIKKNYLSPDAARLMVQNRRTQADKKADGSAAILAELGFDDADNKPPELLKNLADIAASQKTGAVSAISTLLRFAAGGRDGGEFTELRPGDVCPRCGNGVTLGLNVALELVTKLRSAEPKEPQKAARNVGGGR